MKPNLPAGDPRPERASGAFRRQVCEGVAREFLIVVGLGLLFLVPFLGTLFCVTEPRRFAYDPAVPGPNPSPFGYTISLSLFVAPSLVLGLWMLARKVCPEEKRAYLWTLGLLSPLGCLLDVVFGELFLKFENKGAVLGLYLPGFDFTKGWRLSIPVEEFVFYILGFVTVLSLYVWADEFWFAKYKRPDAWRTDDRIKELLHFHPWSLVVGVVLFGMAYAYKKLGPHSAQEGFPGYFLFLLCGSIVPSLVLFNVALPFINWRAFSLAFFYLLVVSQFWEATLGVPYRWWGYEDRQMLGLFVNPFSRLPIEAVIVWLAVTWTTIIVYETLHTVMHMNQEQRRNVRLHVRAKCGEALRRFSRRQSKGPADSQPAD
jgi:hypothetical protein